MVELIALIIFLVSLIGMFVILRRHMPSLSRMPQNGDSGLRRTPLIAGVEHQIKSLLHEFNKKVWLHKLLSWVKVGVLKVEVFIDHLLHGIRKKAQKTDKKRKIDL